MFVVTRLARSLMFVLTTIAMIVPGGLAWNVCLCDASARSEASCAMACCVTQHHGGRAPASAESEPRPCDNCHLVQTGERDGPAPVPTAHKLPQVAALPFTAPILLTVEWAPVALDGFSRGWFGLSPPGRFNTLPLRI